MRDIRVDINGDIGESFGEYTLGDDENLAAVLSSANVACGFHAGDPRVMRKTVEICRQKNVSVGAHVGYPDLAGFGRRNMHCTPDEVYENCLYQISALAGFCRSAGIPLAHVKAHGALYNQAAGELALALAIAQAAFDFDPKLILLGLAGSLFEEASGIVGVKFASEVFADRAYQDDGSLVPRSSPGSVFHDPEEIARRTVQMVKEGATESASGKRVDLKVDSICLHGDTPGAVDIARRVRSELEAAGVAIVPLAQVVGA